VTPGDQDAKAVDHDAEIHDVFHAVRKDYLHRRHLRSRLQLINLEVWLTATIIRRCVGNILIRASFFLNINIEPLINLIICHKMIKITVVFMFDVTDGQT